MTPPNIMRTCIGCLHAWYDHDYHTPRDAAGTGCPTQGRVDAIRPYASTPRTTGACLTVGSVILLNRASDCAGTPLAGGGQTRTPTAVGRHVLAPQCPWFAMRPQSQASP